MASPIKIPVWKGSKELIEQAGSPDWNIDESGTRISRRYEGPYTKVKAEIDSGRIARGKTMPDLGNGYANYPIKTIRFTPEEGGVGVLTLTLDNYSGPASGGDGGSDTTIEVEWVQLEKSITQHPYFTSHLTAAEINQVVKAVEDGAALSETGNIYKWGLYNRLKQGTDSYLVFAPVVRRTTSLSSQPTGQSAGILQNPPSGGPSGSWEYLKTADRSVSPGQNSDWDRIEEWTGADEWDPILYS